MKEFPQENKEEYKTRCLVFTAVLAILLFCIFHKIYESMDSADAGAMLIITYAATAAFVLAQLGSLKSLLAVPESEANLLQHTEIANKWALTFAFSSIGTFGAVMLIGALSLGTLNGYMIATVTFGCGLMGVVAYGIAYGIALVIAPKEYRPWTTEAGYQSYLARIAAQRARAQAMAARLDRDRGYSDSSTQPSSTESVQKPSSVAGIIYSQSEGAFLSSRQEVGFFDYEKYIYRGNSSSWSPNKLGYYGDGDICSNSGVVFKDVVGRYEHSGVYNGYLLYRNGSSESVGLVKDSGDIIRFKHPHSGSAVYDLLAGTDTEIIGSYSGSNAEGAAAAAFLLLFT